MIERVLFLSPPIEDYLAVTMLHGLRKHLGANIVDWPRYDVAYRDYPLERRSRVYGRGFTAFFNLDPIEVDRGNIEARLKAGYFDLVVVSDIWHLYTLFAGWHNLLNPSNTILVDGADTPQVYPYAGCWWRNPRHWFLPRAHRGFLYFKREWTENSRFNAWHRLLPRSIRCALPHYNGLRTVSFSIPEEKIVKLVPFKSKDFPRHIVDTEVALKVHGSSTTYAFNNEKEYYADLQASRFGITMKRSGWDCLRHYEIAANGCVPCFRDLDKKPENCAPHGLEHGKNCLSYSSTSDLLRQIRAIDIECYKSLLDGAMNWVRANSCSERAYEVLCEWQRHI